MNFHINLYLTALLASVECFFFTAKESAEWASLSFILPNEHQVHGYLCKYHSRYYCLDKYLTQNRFGNDVLTQDPITERNSAIFESLIQSEWRRINMVDTMIDPTTCCFDQTATYVVFGLQNQRMSPQEYLNKLMDYKEDNKPLNFIAAYYSSEVCKNIIFQVGFGPGLLERYPHRQVLEGVPYVIPGEDFDSTVAIPGLKSVTFDYYHPERTLTFTWFKHNIMCKDNPWICRGSVGNSTRSMRSNRVNEAQSGESSRRQNGLSQSKRRKVNIQSRNEKPNTRQSKRRTSTSRQNNQRKSKQQNEGNQKAQMEF
ncbi:uncharacterized protein LOC142357303 [Convolutriloba macropyga]|uniref:uncharacterized protein LOC142357303 n=1 Tax=Convolutriloba macropyga TaxID=536237 RepID=UPI003F524978